MNYFEKHIGDYLKDTSHLSLLEHGIYNRLLDVYYTREGAIPDDQAARLIGARSRDEKAALRDVLQEFFQLFEGAWHQPRCQTEIVRFQDKQTKARRSAEARWGAPRTQSDGNADAYANASPEHHASDMRTHSEGNAPRARPQTPDSKHQTPERDAHPQASGIGTKAGEVTRALRAVGCMASPSHVGLQRLVAAGIEPSEFVDVAKEHPGKPLGYILAAVEGRRNDAAAKGNVAAKADPDDWTRNAA